MLGRPARPSSELEDKYKHEIAAGGGEGPCEAGGLFILGTERHESRRIDNQLRGRSGRQGDPGDVPLLPQSWRTISCASSAASGSTAMMEALGIDEDTPIENKMLTNSIESAQRKVEERNFGIRRNVLQYDDVMNRQREIIYSQRDKVLDGEKRPGRHHRT